MAVRQGIKWGRKSARYRMGQNEEHPVRFKSRKTHKILTSKIFDISVSGMSFITNLRLAPHVGELIKMEFAPMGSMQIACVALVVRIELPSEQSDWDRFPETVKVGITFHDMPKKYREMLARSLEVVFMSQAYKEQKERNLRLVRARERNGQWEKPWIIENAFTFLATLTLVGGLIYGIYYVTENSDSFSRPEAAWAQDFFKKVIVTPPKN